MANPNPLHEAAPDPATETAHAFLRRETAAWHQAVEAVFAGLDLQSRPGLSAFLTAQARAVLAIEDALERGGVAALCPDWGRRKRDARLRADLHDLDCPVPAPAQRFELSTPGEVLGALYVVEGSRLGGKLLARQVRLSPDPTVRTAVRFLDHEPEPQAWQHFRALLNGAEADRQDLLRGAARAFARFQMAAAPTIEVGAESR